MSRRYEPDHGTIQVVGTDHNTATSDDSLNDASVGGGRRTAIDVAVVAATVAVVAFAAMVRWDDWYVNYDGGIYLSLATNLRRGVGFVFPDGSFAGFRGPVYPGLIAGAWIFVSDTARSAIWVSRLLLVANAVVLSLILLRVSGRRTVALLAGVFVAVQPLVLVSGALFFVPDGVTVLFILGAVLAYVWTRDGAVGPVNLGFVGLMIGCAFLSKQTGGLGGLVVTGLLASASTGGARRLMRAVPPMGIGFMVPVGVWSAYSLFEAGRLPTGVPGPGGRVWGAVVLLTIVAALAGWTLASRQMHEPGAGTRPAPWISVGATFVVAFGGLVMFGSAAIVPVTELWNSLRADLLTQLYRDTPWGWLLFPLVLAVGWGAVRLKSDGALMAMLMTAVGFAGILYAALSGAGFRNGLLIVYGLAGLLALAFGELWNVSIGRAWWRSVVTAGAVVAIVGSSLAAQVTNDRLPEQSLTAENPAVIDAANWMSTWEPGTTAAGTPLYLSTLWRLSRSHPDLSLAPLHTIGRVEWDGGERTFPHRVAWAGTVSDSVPLLDPIGLSSARVQLAAFMAPTFNEHLRLNRPTYVIVTGNATFPKSTFDGGLLLPYLEASSSARPVYRSGEGRLPQWVMIYELSYPFAAPEVPTLVHLAADLPLESIVPGEIVLSSPQYRDMVIDIMRRPFGDG